jgi:predicted Zn-dependent protease
VESARYERAVARLAGGDGARAEPELAALLREQPDELLRAS